MQHPFIEFEGVRVLNLPASKAVCDEVWTQDCYRFREIPAGSLVIDGGAFYGEFSVLMAKTCYVVAIEAAKPNAEILVANLKLPSEARPVYFIHGTLGVSGKWVYNPEHPAGSHVVSEDGGKLYHLGQLIETHREKAANELGHPPVAVAVKLDIEGAESEVFKDTTWIDYVTIVMMEWHNYDGHIYAEILRNKGFHVELEGNGPKPRPAYDASFKGGLLWAKRK